MTYNTNARITVELNDTAILRDAWRVSSETDTDQLGARPYCEPCSMHGIVSAPWAVVDMPFDDGTTDPAMCASYCEECLNQLCPDAAELTELILDAM